MVSPVQSLSTYLPWSSLYHSDDERAGAYCHGFKRGTLRPIRVRCLDSVRHYLEGKELAVMSNEEHAFQRCLDAAPELEAGPRSASRRVGSADQPSHLLYRTPALGSIFSEVVRLGLPLRLARHLHKWASQPRCPHSALTGLACVSPVRPAPERGLLLCLWAAFDVSSVLFRLPRV